MSRICLALGILAFLPAHSVYAATIDEAGAQRLKASLQEMLDYQKTVNEAFGDVTLAFEGDLTVVPQADFYAVTLPNIAVKGDVPVVEPVPPADGSAPVEPVAPATKEAVFNFGVITMNAVPDDAVEGAWKITASIPQSYSFLDEVNETVKINFGGQSITGLYVEKLGYFTKMDANIQDVTLELAGKDSGFKLGNLKIFSNLDDIGEGRYTGPGYVSATNVTYKDEVEKADISLGELKADFNFSKVLFPTLSEYKEKFLKHKDTLLSLKNAETNPEAVDGQKIYEMIADLYSFKMDGFEFAYTVNNLLIDSSAAPAPEGSTEPTKFTLGTGTIGMRVAGLEGDEGQLGIKFGFSDAAAEPLDLEIKEVVPSNVNIDLSADKIPVKALSELATNSIQGVIASPESAEMVGLAALMKAPAILSQAGSKVSINNSTIKGSIYNIASTGTLVTDLNALMSFTADIKTHFAGLDELLALAKTNAAKPDSQNASSFTEMASTLESLKSYGTPVQSMFGGTTGYDFNFVVGGDGKMTVNGKDVSALMGGGDVGVDGTAPVEMGLEQPAPADQAPAAE